MGFFDSLFGKKSPSPADKRPPARGPAGIEGPPEVVRGLELQRTYWTHRPEEQSQLEARGIDQLGWRELLRLHHLLCLERLKPGSEIVASSEKCRQTLRRLVAPESPYRPRPAMVWQGESAQPENNREPDLKGEFLNPSLTHLGCLEVYTVDESFFPTGLDFVGFDELAEVMFARPSLLRAGKLFFNDGRDRLILAPLLYGVTWELGNQYDREGRMTRFLAHLDGAEFAELGVSSVGVGVGQQDLSIVSDGAGSLFGLGSVAQISFPLDMRDLRFDEKARARGIDPDKIRRQMM